MAYWLTLLLLGSLYVNGAATPAALTTVATDTTHLARARQHEAHRAYDQAINAYERAKAQASQVRDDPTVVFVLNRLASLYAREPETQEQAAAYLDSATTGPGGEAVRKRHAASAHLGYPGRTSRSPLGV